MMHIFVPFLLLFVFACGKSKDRNSSSDATPSRERESGEDVIRYDTVTVEKNCGFWTDCDYFVRGEFNQRPVTLNAHFLNNSLPDETGACDFQVSLSEEESDELEARAGKLKYCKIRNTPTVDRGFDGLFLTDRNGKEILVYKYSGGGQTESGKVNYLCGGRKPYYDYLRTLIEARAPDTCPSGYLKLFF